MSRDSGRQQAYRAEAAAFGGQWHQNTCIAPVLSQEDFLAMNDMVIDYCRKELGTKEPTPTIVIRRRRRPSYLIHSNEIRYPNYRLSSMMILHEVAHWATSWCLGHGEVWRCAYSRLIREFVGNEVADRFLAECREQPLRAVAAGASRPRRKFSLLRRGDGDIQFQLALGVSNENPH